MAVEKRITSPLMVPASIEKILEIDSHISKFMHVAYTSVSMSMC